MVAAPRISVGFALVALLAAECSGSEASGTLDTNVMVVGGAFGGGGAGGSGGGGGAQVRMVTGPLAYDLDGVHKEGDLAFARRMGPGALQMGGSTELNDNVVEIYIMRALPAITTGDYDCMSTAFLTVSIRSAYYTSEAGTCQVNLSEVGKVGDPVIGSFSGILRRQMNPDQTPITVTHGTFSGIISGM